MALSHSTSIRRRGPFTALALSVLLFALGWSLSALAQDAEPLPLADTDELTELVSPLALYPDDLIAIMLPASTYPLQIVEAQRFLDAKADDPTLTPDPQWDDSIVALLNYPEALALLNDDLDWTWRLGEAVLAQQPDVLEAIESFRDQAFLAGNLASDDYQTVSRGDDGIVIEPAVPDVIYIPYYDPVQVIVRRPHRHYFYYDHAYPVYYYPYSVGHRFYNDPFFWGVSSVFAISWHHRYLHLNYFDTRRHPYYGYRYDSRRFFRHRHARDYHVYGGGGRFDRRGGDYRWFPGRYHGVRPNYSRHRATRQLTYNRDGYTHRQANDSRPRHRYSRSGADRDTGSSQRQRYARGERSGERNADGRRARNDRATISRSRDNNRANTARQPAPVTRSRDTARSERRVVERATATPRMSREPARAARSAPDASRPRMAAPERRAAPARQSTPKPATRGESSRRYATPSRSRSSAPRASAPKRSARGGERRARSSSRRSRD